MDLYHGVSCNSQVSQCLFCFAMTHYIWSPLSKEKLTFKMFPNKRNPQIKWFTDSFHTIFCYLFCILNSIFPIIESIIFNIFLYYFQLFIHWVQTWPCVTLMNNPLHIFALSSMLLRTYLNWIYDYLKLPQDFIQKQ